MKNKKTLIKYCIKLTLTITALVLLLRLVGGKKIGNALLNTDPFWLLCMYLCMLIRRFVEAFQMRTLLKMMNSDVSTGRIFLANSLSTMYGLILPGDVVAAGAKWADLSAATGKKSMILNAIIYNRLSLICPFLLIGGIAFALEDPFGNPEFRLAVFIFIVCVGAGSLCLYHPKLSQFIDKAVQATAVLLPKSVASRIDMVISSMHAFRAMPPHEHLVILSLSVMAALFSFGTFAFASLALGLQIPILTMIWVNAILKIVRLLPITISNIGVREGLLIVVLGLYGVEAETAVALGVVFFTSMLIISFVGFGYQIALTMGWVRWHTAGAEKRIDA